MRTYIVPHLQRTELPYDALLAPLEEKRYEWSAKDLLAKTDGWQQLVVAAAIDSALVKSIAVRLAICGTGECYFDDVRLLAGTPRAAE